MTTNKVGIFDEAFKSRIHVSLYYKPLDKDQTREIWEVNFRRIKESRPNISFDREALIKWVKADWKNTKNDGELRPWNGRQIHNACQTAAALAEFQNGGVLTTDHLDAVNLASKEFDKYLMATHGKDDMARASETGARGDDVFDEMYTSRSKSKRASPPPKKRSKKSKKSPSPSPSESISDSEDKHSEHSDSD